MLPGAHGRTPTPRRHAAAPLERPVRVRCRDESHEYHGCDEVPSVQKHRRSRADTGTRARHKRQTEASSAHKTRTLDHGPQRGTDRARSHAHHPQAHRAVRRAPSTPHSSTLVTLAAGASGRASPAHHLAPPPMRPARPAPPPMDPPLYISYTVGEMKGAKSDACRPAMRPSCPMSSRRVSRSRAWLIAAAKLTCWRMMAIMWARASVTERVPSDLHCRCAADAVP